MSPTPLVIGRQLPHQIAPFPSNAGYAGPRTSSAIANPLLLHGPFAVLILSLLIDITLASVAQPAPALLCGPPSGGA